MQLPVHWKRFRRAKICPNFFFRLKRDGHESLGGQDKGAQEGEEVEGVGQGDSEKVVIFRYVRHSRDLLGIPCHLLAPQVARKTHRVCAAIDLQNSNSGVVGSPPVLVFDLSLKDAFCHSINRVVVVKLRELKRGNCFISRLDEIDSLSWKKLCIKYVGELSP